jgi:5-methyltetrahydropteroyltriglutamate--homocysteine methyltransferase
MPDKMLETTIAGSLPKPAWLATPGPCGRPGISRRRPRGRQARCGASGPPDQEEAGIDIITDGEQTRRHFVWGFVERLEGVDFSKMITIGIRADRYKADVPTVSGAAATQGPIHSDEVRYLRAQDPAAHQVHHAGP